MVCDFRLITRPVSALRPAEYGFGRGLGLAGFVLGLGLVLVGIGLV